MRAAMEHLSGVVIQTYKVCMDQSVALTAKHAKLAEIVTVEPDLITICEFSREETANCKVERIRIKMQSLALALEADSKAIREEFHIMKSDPHIYQKIFDGLLRVLDNITAFLKEGHHVETARVLDAAVEAVSAVKAVRDASDEEELVTLGGTASRQCLDLLRAAKRLLAPQEETLKALGPRLDAAHLLMQTSLPAFLQKCKERIEFPSDDSFETQAKSLSQLVAILEEIIAVVREVTPDYDSTFKDSVVDAEDANAIKLRSAVDKLAGMLTKLHTMEGASDEGTSIKSEVIDLTRSMLPDLGVTTQEKAELVTAVKQGLSDSHRDYFQSQKALAELKKPKRAVIVDTAVEEEGSKDLIEAAKGMLSALSGVSSALAESAQAATSTPAQ
jgi:soluble cytochrome b562